VDLTPSPQEEAFRTELRAWLVTNVPASFEGEPFVEDPGYVRYLKAWQRNLAEAGWLGLTWPSEYGGRGLGPVEQTILLEELARANAPPILGILGIGIVGPTIAALGSDKQKQRHLGKMLLGEEIWAAGFSEPNAGSDLASLSTRAVRNRDEFVVNGQKIWTSYAHVADWILVIARTDPSTEKTRGVSCLLVDMTSEGVSVRPLRQMTGDAEFNEVFFTDVRVPQDNLLGTLDDGWNVLMTALMHERTNLGGDYQVQMAQFLHRLIEAARDLGVVEDPVVRQKIARSHVELEVLRQTSARALARVAGGGRPGPESAILKIFWSELDQRLSRRAMEILGPYGQLTEGGHGEASSAYLRSRGSTIGAGTSEVMRNTLASRVLGLPKSF
jgi:alkylation response protein AidB-like acyl-CoA dehydrogenase